MGVIGMHVEIVSCENYCINKIIIEIFDTFYLQYPHMIIE